MNWRRWPTASSISRHDPQSTPGVANSPRPTIPELLAHMAEASSSGTGWINLEPVIDEEHEPPQPGPFAFLGGSTHKVPTATWLPGKHNPNGTMKPTTIGLQHASGPRVARRLADLGCPLPDGWRITQDHPRRGLVALVPADTDQRSGHRLAPSGGDPGVHGPFHRSVDRLGPRRPQLTQPLRPKLVPRPASLLTVSLASLFADHRDRLPSDRPPRSGGGGRVGI